MGMEMRQQLKLSQQLVMTPQLQQAIKLLQLSRMELVDLVHQEMLDNPMLEDGELSVQTDSSTDDNSASGNEVPAEASGESSKDSTVESAKDSNQQEVSGTDVANDIDWENYLNNYQLGPSTGPGVRRNAEDIPSLEATLTSKPSLYDHLAWQLKMASLPEDQEQVGMLIIGNIDSAGYLKDPPMQEIASQFSMTIDQVEEVIDCIQSFDPIGIGARSLAECLLNQAIHFGQDDELLVKMIRFHLPNLEKRKYQAIAKDLGEPLEEIYEAAKVIMEFDPRPGRQYSSDEAHYITPDVYIHKVGDKYFVVTNDDGLPKLRISSLYKSAMNSGNSAKDYIQDKLRSAQWLIRSIQQRQRTIVKVTESILKFQYDFFDKGVEHLKPLVLRDVAEDISMHESTVSRVTTAKYVHTPQGIFELKYFFNSSVPSTEGNDMASEAVKSQLKKAIASEDPEKPYSDQKLVVMLRENGVDIARRTVAKYRDQLGILSSSKRKKLF